MSDIPVKTRAARPPPPRLARAMGKQIAHLAERTGAMDPALIVAWPEIAGSELASLCRPVKLARKAKIMTLVVSVPTGAAAMRVQYAQTQILQRAAHFLRQPTLRKLMIEQRGNASNTKKPQASRWASNTLTLADVPTPKPIAEITRPARSVEEALTNLRRVMSSSGR